MMLPLRPAVASTLTRSIRPLSIASPSDRITIDNAFAALSTTPPAPTSPAAAPFVTIPPVEDPLLHYLTSSLLKHGHRARASRITARTLLHIHTLTRSPPLPVLRAAIMEAAPAVRSVMQRQGSKSVAKPVALGEKQRVRFAVQWILEASEGKMGKTVEERLAREIVAVVQGTSQALKKKEETHRFAMVNRGNARSRI